MPPPSQGSPRCARSNLLEGFDLRSLGPRSADYWHLFVEAKRSPGRTAPLPSPTLERARSGGELNLQTLRGRAAQADRPAPRRAGQAAAGRAAARRHSVPRGRRRGANCVSLMQSIYQHFDRHGSRQAGIRGWQKRDRSSRSIRPSQRLEPHKRPSTPIIPALATRGGKPWFVFGVMGADMQPQGQRRSCERPRLRMNVQAAGEAPRIEHLGSPTPTGRPEAPGAGCSPSSKGSAGRLRRAGARGPRGGVVERQWRRYQGILIDPATGALQGGIGTALRRLRRGILTA